MIEIGLQACEEVPQLLSLSTVNGGWCEFCFGNGDLELLILDLEIGCDLLQIGELLHHDFHHRCYYNLKLGFDLWRSGAFSDAGRSRHRTVNQYYSRVIVP